MLLSDPGRGRKTIQCIDGGNQTIDIRQPTKKKLYRQPKPIYKQKTINIFFLARAKQASPESPGGRRAGHANDA
jgi:hypothetical protein